MGFEHEDNRLRIEQVISKYSLATQGTLIRMCDKKDRQIEILKEALKEIRDCLSDGDTCNVDTAAEIAVKALGRTA